MQSLSLSRYEALLRHSEHSDNTERLIRNIEERGDISKLDLHTMDQIINIIHATPCLYNVPIAQNISPISLCDGDFQQKALIMLRQRPSWAQISLEITETSPILDLSIADRFVRCLKGIGCTIGLDDFGSGYSSLETARELQLDYLKLSSGLTTELDDRNKRDLINQAISFAEDNRMDVVAEHIDNITQFKLLKSLGIRYGQGWLFAKADTPLKDIQQFNGKLFNELNDQ